MHAYKFKETNKAESVSSQYKDFTNEYMFKKEKLINVNLWPSFEDFDFEDLREISLDLISELEEREIFISGISVGKSEVEGSPLFYVHLDRINRNYRESQDIPDNFDGFDVRKVTTGKFKL